jgi:DNA-binding XRE family transcriptional regulator
MTPEKAVYIIRSLVDEYGISQSTMAKHLDMSRGGFIKVYNGQSRPSSVFVSNASRLIRRIRMEMSNG